MSKKLPENSKENAFASFYLMKLLAYDFIKKETPAQVFVCATVPTLKQWKNL